ncbi:MAG TPA: biopolymer transporter ExbD [Verrucomicrobiae bacterium]|jgi:biopolymer transport protein ExbD|nr:biopolymer transporter ExbD [Verrucomicrobiae bacterium]
MKFPRNAKLLRSPFDVAPFATVFFLIIIFLLLGAFLPAPGLSLKLPQFEVSNLSDDLPGTDKPTVAVAIDSAGRLFFSNQMVTESQLKIQLHHAVISSKAPLTLVIQADQLVTYSNLVTVSLLARDAGISDAILATQPRIVAAPGQP